MSNLEKYEEILKAIIQESEEYYLEPTGTWIDSYNFEIVTQEAADAAFSFLKLLPEEDIPELSGDPHGRVSIEFFYSKERVLSLSVEENSRICYAWVSDGDSSGSGYLEFDNEKIPDEIGDIMSRMKSSTK